MRKKVRDVAIRYGGISHDCRTNVWLVDCECGKSFKPMTTRLAYHEFQCGLCGRSYAANYNDEKVWSIDV